MKTLKIIFAALGIIILLSSIGGYLYLKDMMKAPPNVVHVIGDPTHLNVSWISNDFSDRVAMLVPVQLPTIPDTFYMQFDFGAVYSLIYAKPLKDIKAKYPTFPLERSVYNYDFSFDLGNMEVSYDSIKQVNFGEPINWEDKDEKIIIGTIGADFIELVKTTVDFPNSQISFALEGAETLPSHAKEVPIEFKDRKLMINTIINGKQKKLMWDSGASAYDLITSEKNWEKMANNPDDAIIHPANQLNRPLKVYTAQTDDMVAFDGKEIPLKTVTYVKGFPWYIELAFSTSGMEGMIGNNIFRDYKIYVDVEEKKLVFM